ncbi:UvrD-helicase domain-containing protein [Georgenia sp. H159]|uniref:UvrD-helicase domain-containing protein n=1 Tax=Georgenia sp. H159 TaxID=3076115 RepID=UPI002D779514|nr:UvrD-helicase domain-containing protein [Georgenia sp. H159]
MSALVDATARDRITGDTGTGLLVEAGAGSGKTRSLVERVVTLVLDDGVRLGEVAAVTFTEKAGAELRDRLREAFERCWRAARTDGTDASRLAGERAAVALDDLDSAAIGTLHSFAQRILTRHPIEAGLPPLVEVLDEVASSVAFEQRWAELRQRLLDEESLSQPLLLAMTAGVKLDHLRSLTKALGSDWDLIEDHVLTSGPPRLGFPDVAALATRAARLAERAAECTDPEDKFLPRLAALREWGEQLTGARDDRERLAALVAAEGLRFGHGRKASWGGALDEIRTGCTDLQQEAAAALSDVLEALLRPLTHWLAEQVLGMARERAAEGRLEFHDLLVLARQLLRTDPDVRASLQAAFPRLLLDEFQDTDPIQIELAVRIAGGRDARAEDWRDVDVPPGSLFVVGDPKQSIYRFRRADIGLYLRAQEWFGTGRTVRLTTNFRTTEPILDWVNAVFARLVVPSAGSQPDYVPLAAHRPAVATGPAVTVLGAREHDLPARGNADRLRELEATDVAAVIGRALDEGWTVVDPRTREERPVRLEDIAVLVPARTSLPALETALDEAGVPYRAESSSLVYQAQEVRDLLAAARAVADPSDLLSCVTALRSPLLGCGDDDLWSWKRAGGSFNLLAPHDAVDHPVGRALDYLRSLHHRARWMTPSEVLGALVVDRRMLEVAAERPRTRDQWRRLRFVVDQARAWSEVEHGGLRAYLAWAAKQGEESTRVAEAVLPETDVDAVRVMTVHAAKGLEFPMVVLSGLTSQPRTQRGVRLLWRDGGYAVRLTRTVQTNDFSDVQPLDEQMDDLERRRLLYVAATRARDHLVVSLHRAQGTVESNARLLAGAGAGEAGAVEFHDDGGTPAGWSGPGGRSAPPPPDAAAWRQWLETAQAATRRVPSRSASGLEGTEPEIALDEEAPAPGRAKGGRDLDLPAWSKGRYGTAIGRAVHAVLQAVDLTTGAGLEDAVGAQCVAEGITGHEELVADLVRSALASDTVRRAAERRFWRESYTATVEEDGTVLEGFVDLVFRDDDAALVVVDYKTDAVPAEALPARAEYYRPQLQAYCRMLAGATGAEVRGVLVFVAPGGAAEWAVEADARAG